LSTRGLGYPVQPQDARSRGLGGVSLGYPAGEISWFSPGGFIGLLAPALVASYQYDHFDADPGAGEFSGRTARFPLILAGFPFGERVVAFAGYGGFLDQTWRIEDSETLDLADEQVPVTNRFSSDGGVARLRIGGAYEIAEGLGVGVGLDAYTGTVERVQGRIFPHEPVPRCCRATWNYSGVGLTAGAHWSPGEATGLAISVSYGGALDATPVDTVGAPATYDLPLLVRGGASGRISQNTLVAVSGGWDGWSSLDAALAAEGGAHDSWSAHAGLEWDAITLRERPVPLRFGARAGTLPFRWRPEDGNEGVSERAATGGVGVLFAGGAVRSDLAVEVGSRGGETAGIEESFWRFGFSVRVLGR
ncbi:MAG TPA: hypothetical protein VMN39_05705, partial [Longimicrobiaceae bacterium]|nr:hypothetical protein [Longimicrobiaceae bacterium]